MATYLRPPPDVLFSGVAQSGRRRTRFVGSTAAYAIDKGTPSKVYRHECLDGLRPTKACYEPAVHRTRTLMRGRGTNTIATIKSGHTTAQSTL